MMNMNSTRQLKNKNYGSMGYRTAESAYFFGFFWRSLEQRQKLIIKHMIIPHGQPKI
jgi:hypothetical protein